MSDPIIVFDKNLHYAKNGGYRIPSIIRNKDGVLMSSADERIDTMRDNPNRIDQVISYSYDNGTTWTEPTYAVREHGEKMDNASSALDSSLLLDEENGVLYMIYCHTPAKTFILNSRRSVGEDSQKRLILRRNGKGTYYLDKGIILDKSYDKTDYLVDTDGNVTLNGAYISNIYIGDGEFTEDNTSYLMMTESHDFGKTWSKPISLNSQVKKAYMAFIGPCPGIGIKIQKGDKKGRLVFPIYYSTRCFPLMMTSVVIYSDDNGKSWTMGKSPNEARGKAKNAFHYISQKNCLTESQVIEKQDGTLQIFMRNHSPKRLIATAVSNDAGESWYGFRFLNDVSNPICMVSAINFMYNDREIIALCCATDKSKRINGHIKLSVDGGNTFLYSYKVKEGEFVYSSMVFDGENICVLYEPSTIHERIVFEKIPIKNILNK